MKIDLKKVEVIFFCLSTPSRQILRVIVVRYHCHLLPSLSVIAIPWLALPPTLRCWLLRHADLITCLWQSLVAAIVTSHPPVLLTLACSPHHLLPQSVSACCC